MIFLHCKKKLTEPNGLHIPGIYPVPKLRDIGRGLGPIVFQVFDVEKFATHTAKLHSPHNPKVPLQGDLGGLLEKFAMHTIETSKSISEGVTWSDTLATLKIPC